MIRLAILGMGKMGLSHLAIANCHAGARVDALCDSRRMMRDWLSSLQPVPLWSDWRAMLDDVRPDAVIVATPTSTHAEICGFALERGIDVFSEKPHCLTASEGRELADLADRSGRVTQVGYHYRFVSSFARARQMLNDGVLGRIHHFQVSARGPAMLRSERRTWRGRMAEGGGCLYDYGSHAIDLAVDLFGMPQRVSGSGLGRVHSADVDDEAYSTLRYRGGISGHLSVNWADPSERKMSVLVEVWGTNGRMEADRQECRIFLRGDGMPSAGLEPGWNALNGPRINQQVGYYLRGEEYSAQMDYFIESVRTRRTAGVSSFRSTVMTMELLDAIRSDAGEPGNSEIALMRSLPDRGGKGRSIRQRASSALLNLVGRAPWSA